MLLRMHVFRVNVIPTRGVRLRNMRSVMFPTAVVSVVLGHAFGTAVANVFVCVTLCVCVMCAFVPQKGLLHAELLVAILAVRVA